MPHKICAVVLALCCWFGEASVLPSKIQTCRNDEKINDCLKVAVSDAASKLKNGISELKFPPVDPLRIPSMTIGEGVTGAVHVTQNFKNVDIYGISSLKVDNIDLRLTPTTIAFDCDVLIPNMKFKADYDFNGQILVVPIVGKGKSVVDFNNIKINMKVKGESFEKKGNTYMDVKELKLILNPDNVHYEFENLFNGDKRLQDEVSNLINENWKVVFDDVKSGYEESLAIVFKNMFNIFYHSVPIDELYPK